MAHWIIDDWGFGGSYYKCSHCGESWWDILDDINMEDYCPNCGEPINDDDNEYLTNGRRN